MLEVGIRALKARLSELVRRASDGETILVTDHGRPVAELVPHRSSELSPRMAELVRQGKVTLGSGRARLPKPTAKMKPGSSLTDILLEERRHERLLR
jgi:prevent-host-death family protein